MKFLVTGAAGFIGMHTCIRLLKEGHEIVGLDNLNAYYSVALKEYRLKQLESFKLFRFIKMDISDRHAISDLFEREKFQRVIHLAAQAGVRYSIEAPFDYVDSNLTGMMTILEGCRNNDIEHLIYASSSSVYGMNPKVPFSTDDSVDHPVSLYAATKKSNELMAHSYSHLYNIPTTGLRFFTVYGPAGRPDMAPWLFTEAIIKGEPIKVFNNGEMERDFTYIDDIVEGITRIQNEVPINDINNDLRSLSSSTAPYRVFNIGNNNSVKLSDFISAIETSCGKEAEKIMLPMQPGDVKKTYADIASLMKVINYKPKTNICDGVSEFVKWYKSYSTYR
ncbi:NAD-dependent epimerase [Aliiglaciecola sp. 3_MG-2023]|uniref:NAD-dependent epimerase n=1 Tax=Aliiglaciecola sp. 3_MG-2023 TaxID=3062644 RepID=UPI0026E1A791|nr:NAD-dependent epimerase [Aliiglaciecola sp. 3_MG-2023]MDO6693223.1 NAD-dependent epimerase [Aliiglaciecola sp. 3_MG-2023]